MAILVQTLLPGNAKTRVSGAAVAGLAIQPVVSVAPAAAPTVEEPVAVAAAAGVIAAVATAVAVGAAVPVVAEIAD